MELRANLKLPEYILSFLFTDPGFAEGACGPTVWPAQILDRSTS